MADGDTTFLEPAAFEAMFRPLSVAETSQVTLLLEVVSNWISDNKPGIEYDDPAAKLVAFEITREALLYGKYRSLGSFQDTTAHRTKAGTFNTAEVEKFITDRHRQMLGLMSRPRPSYYFGD